ncbi:hypothetical protein XENOCAPTIV_015619 [Xenoophorus captivus]|uniref:Uncharacterized protein n=1 Tax=Xenoophorus captivus TaxID=1517983 RepID=A0ABV0QM22_9TELE
MFGSLSTEGGATQKRCWVSTVFKCLQHSLLPHILSQFLLICGTSGDHRGEKCDGEKTLLKCAGFDLRFKLAYKPFIYLKGIVMAQQHKQKHGFRMGMMTSAYD